MPYTRVLLATDFSEPAREAAAVARQLATQGADVAAVNVMHAALPGGTAWADVPAGKGAYPTPAEVDAARVELTTWLQEEAFRDVPPLVHVGDPGTEIVREAKQRRTDLIVLGARGHSALERLLLGSTARAVVHHAPCDVLVVRSPPAGAPPFRHILVATDFQKPSEVAAAKALRMAERTDAKLSLAHVMSPDPLKTALAGVDSEADARAMLQAFNERVLAGRARTHARVGRPSEVTASMARDVGADLLVIGNHGAKTLERLLLGSTAAALVEQAPCSVLLVRTP